MNESSNIRPATKIDYDVIKQNYNEGGFVNKKTGVVYINTGTQTDSIPKPNQAPKFTRDAQTVFYSTHSQQTKKESGTQMVWFFINTHLYFLIFETKPGLSIAEEGDKIMIPGTYYTSEQWDELLLKTAITLQRWTRGYLARKRMKEMKFILFFFF
jgi:hypothetical protein